MTLDITKCHDGGLDVSEACAAAGGVCQHHGAAYWEMTGTSSLGYNADYIEVANGAPVLQKAITTTKKCCIVVMTAMIIDATIPSTAFEIERPTGTIRTTHEDERSTGELNLIHHAAWEVLVAGSYTYYLMNRAGASRFPNAAWMEIVASDCEG